MASRKLDVYERKRHFDVTPEPPPDGARPRRRGAPTFMVHKHHARRLHYDLRLEMDGVLASWAVPKGPSYDPAVRRLAVETEDHPLSYGAFEGRIPDGEYGAGDSLIWDRGTWETVPPGQAAAMKAKGHLELELRGEKLRGRWHLVRTGSAGGPGKTSWILFKAKDENADPGYDVTTARPESVESGRRVTRGPVAARTLRGAHPAPMELLIRVWPPPPRPIPRGKLRALAAVSGGRVSLQSAEGMDLGHSHPKVAAGLGRLVAGEAVLDADLTPGDLLLARDLLWLEGEDLRARPMRERRELLESLLAPPPPRVDVGPVIRGAPASRGPARA